MKLRALTTILVAASIAASAATAGNPPGKGKDSGRGARGNHQRSTTSPACKGRQLRLVGLYVSGSVDAEGAGSFVVAVTKTDRLGKRLQLAGTQVTVNVDARTKFRRAGKAQLADLLANDRVGVVARACKAAAGSDAAPTLLARLVVARPAAADPGAPGA